MEKKQMEDGVQVRDASRRPFHFTTVEYLQREEDMAGGAVPAVLPHKSVRIVQGDTMVICAVNDGRLSKELPHRLSVEVIFRRKVTGSAGGITPSQSLSLLMEERFLEQTIMGVLEAMLDLEDHRQLGFKFLCEFEGKKCLLSTCLNAASLALQESGFSPQNLFCAITVITLGENMIVDPTTEQVGSYQAGATPKTPFSLFTFALKDASENKLPYQQFLHINTPGIVTPGAASRVLQFVAESPVTAEICSYFWEVVSRNIVGIYGEKPISSEFPKNERTVEGAPRLGELDKDRDEAHGKETTDLEVIKLRERVQLLDGMLRDLEERITKKEADWKKEMNLKDAKIEKLSASSAAIEISKLRRDNMFLGICLDFSKTHIKHLQSNLGHHRPHHDLNLMRALDHFAAQAFVHHNAGPPPNAARNSRLLRGDYG